MASLQPLAEVMNYVEKKSSLSTRDFFCIIIRTTTHQIASMQYVLIIHEVESYPAWKTIFDQAAGIRKSAGEISYQLLRYDEDANNIVHFSQWSCLEKARRFFESAELLEIRKRAGVKAPNFIYLHELERCTL